MANVEIYTWQYCPFCKRAKALLDQKGVPYSEYAIDGDAEARLLMSERAQGRSTVPQIFIDQKPIGGCDALYALEQEGSLNDLLGLGND